MKNYYSHLLVLNSKVGNVIIIIPIAVLKRESTIVDMHHLYIAFIIETYLIIELDKVDNRYIKTRIFELSRYNFDV
jgi:hypothetical protein